MANNENKSQQTLEGNKNSRVNKIIERLMKNKPSLSSLEEWNDTEPEFPTFPTPSQREKAKKQKKSPFLGGGKGLA
jgi:hypothetical protein